MTVGRAQLTGMFVAIIGAAIAWSVLNPGPLPGDLALTRAAQHALGSAPAWAAWITDTAKFPTAWATFALAATLAFAVRGWRGALAAGAAFALAHGLDKLLRLVIFAPRPSADLVAVAAPASSSGLPSTFGLLFGALFGLTLLAALGQRTNAARAIVATSAALITAGLLARVVLGGHWPSQMLLSLAIGMVAAALSLRLTNAPGGKTAHRRR